MVYIYIYILHYLPENSTKCSYIIPYVDRMGMFHREERLKRWVLPFKTTQNTRYPQGTLRFGAPQGGWVRHASELAAHVQPDVGKFKNHSYHLEDHPS